MPVPSSIASLSTTASANPPAGNTPALPEMDDHIRQAYAFIAALRDDKQDKSGTFPYSQLTGAPVVLSRYSPGEWVLSSSITAPAGTLTPNGQTIGSAASGATSRANADTSDLFAVLWNATSNANLPIQDSTGAASTRGASAAADFAANKRLPLPNIQDGDALVAAVSSAVLSRTAGEVLGHTHTVTVDSGGNHSHTLFTGQTGVGSYPVGGPGPVSSTTAPIQNDGDHTHTATATSSGVTKNKAAGLMTRIYIAL